MLSSAAFRAGLAGAAGRAGALGASLHAPGAGFYLLVARKLVVGLRPLRPVQRASMRKLLPLPVAKVSRRDSEN